ARVVRLRSFLEQTQRTLNERASKVAAAQKKPIQALVDEIEVDLESIFKLALSGDREPDLQTFVTYAGHLMFRQERDRCLDVIDQGLKSPQAARRTATYDVINLHTVAVEMILSQAADQNRFEKAAPHIQALLDSPEPRSGGLGHLFAGSIDLDRSGLAREASADDRASAPRDRATSKLRTSALEHLKLAAAALPDVSEAQARYGVALV